MTKSTFTCVLGHFILPPVHNRCIFGIIYYRWSHRCSWRILRTKCGGDNYRCWWRFWPFWSQTSTGFLNRRRAPTSQRCHQHLNFATDIPKSSPTLGQQHHHVTNISVTVLADISCRSCLCSTFNAAHFTNNCSRMSTSVIILWSSGSSQPYPWGIENN